MRMHPDQWEIAHYRGDKTWEIRDDFDFSELGEVLLIDGSAKGAGLFSEFTLSKGRSTIRSGFILPEKVGGETKKWFFIAYDSSIERASLGELWGSIRPGVEAWYESLIRGEIRSLAEFCDNGLEKRHCPPLQGQP
jgi:hypothetical protein